CVHLAPPPTMVPPLMSNLFEWLRKSDQHLLIRSSVFHYEFEYIHPFEDGNGRTGRLWQTVILKKWKPVFAWIPVETLVKKHQQAYYNAFNVSNSNADSTVFIDFMLTLIINALKDNPFVTQAELSIISRIGADKNGRWEVIND
ncbi:MAG: Fic family protein, partial [Bacteroidales bacterium]|nr:Fic family protein [Bacteroidales bacterium]